MQIHGFLPYHSLNPLLICGHFCLHLFIFEKVCNLLLELVCIFVSRNVSLFQQHDDFQVGDI